MELIFAKQRKGNPILLTFSKNCKIKVNWLIEAKNEVMYFWNDSVFLNSYSVNTNQSKL